MVSFFLVALIPLIMHFSMPDKTPLKRIITVGFSFGGEDTILYTALEDFFNKAIEFSLADIDVQYSYAFTNDLLQTSNIRDSIKSKPDVIVIMPQDYLRIIGSIEEAQRAGIPVVMYNRPSDPTSVIQPAAYVGMDTYNQAYTTSIALFKLMREDGIEPRVINLMGRMTDRNAVLRRDGLYDAAEEMDVEILADIETNWDSQTTKDKLVALYPQYNTANALFCASDWIMPGVEQAMKQLGRWHPYGHPKHVYIGSQDVYPLGLTMMYEGYIDVNTAFDIYPMSMMLLQVILMIVNEQELSQSSYLIPGRIVTLNNIESISDLWTEQYMED